MQRKSQEHCSIEQTSAMNGNLHDTQAETDLLHEQLEFYRELVESTNLELHRERQQRQELEQELQYTNHELCLFNQENHELFSALNLELERSKILLIKARESAARHNEHKAKLTTLETKFNELGANFIEFKAYLIARRLSNDTGAELGKSVRNTPLEHME